MLDIPRPMAAPPNSLNSDLRLVIINPPRLIIIMLDKSLPWV
jgi:hypothetical protein